LAVPVGFSQLWEFWSGNWWLAINGTWIGYYPGSVYRGGPLTYGNATFSDFGGETRKGSSSWPEMGSGWAPYNGFGYAAFQNDVWYIDPTYTTVWSSLTPETESPCYDVIITPASAGSSWGTYLYFGGPGGWLTSC
jgi:hypothetical protein